MAMILDLGQFGGFIEATANFSNAVVVAMMPYVSDVAKKLDLPLPQPITQQQMVSGGPNAIFETRNGEMMGCGFEVKGGWIFGFQEGHLAHFETTNSFYTLQNPDEIPRLVGKVKMSKEEAVQMARNTLKNLDIPLEAIFAEQEPHVRMPAKTRTGIVPHYLIKWLSPRSSADSESWSESVEIEINGNAKRVEYITIAHNANLRRPWPKFDAAPVLRKKKSLSANTDYAWKLLPIVLRAVDEYGKALELPVPRPLTTNHVARFKVSDNGGWPHSELELTNGWRFVYRNTAVNGYYAPDALFDFDLHPILIKDLSGKRSMSEGDAVKLIRRAMTKLNYPASLVQMDFKPKVIKSAVPSVPRYQFWWHALDKDKESMVSRVEAEMDMAKGELKSLYFDNKELWNTAPPIDVPIAAPVSRDRVEAVKVEAQQPKPKPSSRPFAPFPSTSGKK